MGMFDYLKVSERFLPATIKAHTDEWQTKSHDKFLNTLVIKDDSKLYVDNIVDNCIKEGEFKFLPYTGEIRFYKTIEEKWWKFVELSNADNIKNISP